jgi:hypothetical protein
MRTFKNAWFVKFARREGISNEALKNAIASASDGLIDAKLGGGLIKLRVARDGAGKSGGYRTIVCFAQSRRAVFAYGFAKNKMANLSPIDLAALKAVAKLYLEPSEADIDVLIERGLLEEIRDDDQEDPKPNLPQRRHRRRS